VHDSLTDVNAGSLTNGLKRYYILGVIEKESKPKGDGCPHDSALMAPSWPIYNN